MASAREIAFRASHGMSSGGWYAARREAKSRGVSGKDFDTLYRTPTGRTQVKALVQAKRAAHRNATEAAVQRIRQAIAALPPGTVVAWGST